MDEVGLIVRSISDRGLMGFELTGNIDSRSLLNREVDVIGRDGALIRGVIGNLSRHLQTEEESQERISHRHASTTGRSRSRISTRSRPIRPW